MDRRFHRRGFIQFHKLKYSLLIDGLSWGSQLIVLKSETCRYIGKHIDLLKPIQDIKHYVMPLHILLGLYYYEYFNYFLDECIQNESFIKMNVYSHEFTHSFVSYRVLIYFSVYSIPAIDNNRFQGVLNRVTFFD